MRSQHSVRIGKIFCHSKDMDIFYYMRIVMFSWEMGSIVFEYEVLPDSDDTL